MGRNRKSDQPSARDGLASNVIEALAKDFAEHGREAIERIREESPAKYGELVARLIPSDAPVPAPGAYADCNSLRDIGLKLLQQIGLSDPTEDEIAEACAANDTFMATLEAIKARALQ
jgi:hypothetical protein